MKSGVLVVASVACSAEANRHMGMQRRHLHHLRSDVHSQSLHHAVGEELGNPKCPCIGFDDVAGETKVVIESEARDVVVSYPASLGSSCTDWDNGRHPFCKSQDASGFCKDKWCYVSPKDCHLPTLPKQSMYVPKATFQGMPVHYSYATCGAQDKYTAAAPTVGKDGCRCVGFAGSPGMTVANIDGKKVEYPAEIGGECKAWDSGHHTDCTGADDQPDWCEKKWCIVDPCSCTGVVTPKVTTYLTGGEFQGKPLFWSYATCGDEDSFSKEGDLEKSKKVVDKLCNAEKENDKTVYGKPDCPCIGFDGVDGETVATIDHLGSQTEVSYPADLGGTCDNWDGGSHPTCKGDNAPSWCRSSWCYVDPRHCSLPILPKPSAYQPDAKYQQMRLFYSYSTCGGKDTWTKNAPDVGKPGCRCIGIDKMPGAIPVTMDGTQVNYPAEMGGQCKTWDADHHPSCVGKDKADWCSKKWCYVDPCSCDISVPPKTASFLGDATFQGKKVFWSYATCGDTDSFSTEEHQKKSKAEIKELCSPATEAAVYTKRPEEPKQKSGAQGMPCLVSLFAVGLSLLTAK